MQQTPSLNKSGSSINIESTPSPMKAVQMGVTISIDEMLKQKSVQYMGDLLQIESISTEQD